MIFFNSEFDLFIKSLKGKIRVIFAVKIGLTKDIDSAKEFCLKETFNPIFKGFPGKLRFRLMSELNELLKYVGFIGSKLFLVSLSEIKLTFEENDQFGFDLRAFRCDQKIVALLFVSLEGNPVRYCWKPNDNLPEKAYRFA
jgi:hypothetical protein